MSREEIQQLLCGYATNTLDEGERRALFEAALEDQELFDALAKEQALRDVLSDPVSRQQLLDALEPAPAPARMRAWQWLRRPAALAVVGGIAILLVVAGLALRRTRALPHRELILADVQAPPAPHTPPPTAAPAKIFNAPKPQQRNELQAVLPKPPMLNPQYDVESKFLPALAPTPPADAVVRFATPLARSEEVARRLYSRPITEAMGIGGALPQTRAKIARTGAAAPTASNLGVRYSLLLKGSDGEYAPARLNTEFHAGDSVRVRLVPNDSGYLYLFQRDSAGGWRLASTQRVTRGQPCLSPANDALQYDQPGRKELLVVLSPREEPSLVSLDTAELDALAASVRTNILKATVSSGESAYAVDTRLQAGQEKVAFEITLEFR